MNERFGNSEQLAQPDAAGGLNEQSGNSGQLQGDARVPPSDFYAWLDTRCGSDFPDAYALELSRDAWQAALAARQPVGQEPFAWATHHDEPMLYPTFAEAAAYCDDDEPPIPLYTAPPAPAAVEDELAAWRELADHVRTGVQVWPDRYTDARTRDVAAFIRMHQAAPAAVPVDALLASDHSGMRVDYAGLIRQTRGALTRGERDPALAEMQRQLAGHLEQLGKRWYTGDTSVVDELLQLYCIEPIARAGLKTTHPLPAAARSPCACHDHADAVCSEHQPAGEVQP
ncbi:hypothetical protein [Xanthomonas arboricola]|uniref:hypothetical protein n=1 Tax=Xanthomonas arboricola TaxID=56448 RepID=UPI000C820CC9|nr:hypothetical protein [Xanthomonas arboricola]PPU28669.1 hypothetical protein XarCFBP6762_05310 [Xanthomonas arboricola]SOT99611.1 hypothetical protein CFBP6762_02260 [Xanthomonas arboricola pv. fragariae]